MGLAYKGGYFVFQVTNGSTNHCSPCPADPGTFASGARCWIPEAKTELMTLIISAQAQDRQVNGRVLSWTNCEIYQFQLE